MRDRTHETRYPASGIGHPHRDRPDRRRFAIELDLISIAEQWKHAPAVDSQDCAPPISEGRSEEIECTIAPGGIGLISVRCHLCHR